MSYKLYKLSSFHPNYLKPTNKIYLSLEFMRMMGQIRSIELTFAILNLKWLIPHLASTNDGPNTIEL